MKKKTFKPGFEFIFSLCILAVLGLPPLVFAQAPKDLQITINNGDTTINGKNIKDISSDERKNALKDIKQIAVIDEDDKTGNNNMVTVKRRHNSSKAGDDVVIEKREMNGNEDEPMIADNDVKVNGNRHMRIMIKRDSNDSTFAYNYKSDGGPRHKMEVHQFHMNGDGPMGLHRRNTQNFMYSTTDNNGATTHVAFHVSDHPAMIDFDGGKQKDLQLDMLDLMDLNIIPEFSEGKTMLMFSLPAKTIAEVQFKDSKGTLLWSAKAVNGQFSKSFPLGLNGEYYLQVKQGSKVAVKKIEKE